MLPAKTPAPYASNYSIIVVYSPPDLLASPLEMCRVMYMKAEFEEVEVRGKGHEG